MTAAGKGRLAQMPLETLVERRTELSRELDRVFADIAVVSRGLSMKGGSQAAVAKSGAKKRRRGDPPAAVGKNTAAKGMLKDLQEAVRTKLAQAPGTSAREVATLIAEEGGAGDDQEIVRMLQKKVSNILVQWKKAGKATAEGHGRDWKWSLAVPSGGAGD